MSGLADALAWKAAMRRTTQLAHEARAAAVARESVALVKAVRACGADVFRFAVTALQNADRWEDAGNVEDVVTALGDLETAAHAAYYGRAA